MSDPEDPATLAVPHTPAVGQEDPTHRRAVLWLLAANVLFVAGAALSTRYVEVTLPVAGAIASAVALGGVSQLLRHPAGRAASPWWSRAQSLAVGTLTLCAIHILVPYIAYAEGQSLWTERGYAAVGVVVAAGGVAAWNAALLWPEAGLVPRAVQWLLALSLLMAAVAFLLALRGFDSETVPWRFRDLVVDRVHLQAAPLVAVMQSAWWIGAWLRVGRLVS